MLVLDMPMDVPKIVKAFGIAKMKYGINPDNVSVIGLKPILGKDGKPTNTFEIVINVYQVTGGLLKPTNNNVFPKKIDTISTGVIISPKDDNVWASEEGKVNINQADEAQKRADEGN